MQITDNIWINAEDENNVSTSIDIVVSAVLDPEKTLIKVERIGPVAYPDGSVITTLKGMEDCFVSKYSNFIVVCNGDGVLELIEFVGTIGIEDGNIVVEVPDYGYNVTYQWYVVEDGDTTIIEGETSAVLSGENIVIGNTYKCAIFVEGELITTLSIDYSYEITHQPTVKEPYVELNDDTDATYQWYTVEGDRTEVTDDGEIGSAIILGEGYKSSYDAETGWTGLYLDGMSGFFMVNLKGGETITLIPSKDMQIMISAQGAGYGTGDFCGAGESFTYTAEITGTYGVLAYCDPDTTLRAYLDGETRTAVEGATSSRLTYAQPGTYACEVTFKDGTKELSEKVTLTQAICEHSYGEPAFAWAEDGKSCAVTFTCANDSTHTATYDAVVTSKVKTEPTYTEMGVTTYTATYTDETGTYTDTKDVQDIPVLETPVEPPVTDTVEAFVERMYTVALGRPSDAEGKANWVTMLKANTHDGAGLATEFILGAEFALRGLTDEEYVDVLYHTFFNREADQGGKELWLAVLASGQTREYVLSNFVNLPEFTFVCASYGIERGVMLENGQAVNPGIPQFVKRMYTIVLRRDAENEGLYNNVLALVVGALNAEQVAKNFFTSAEYLEKNKDTESYVKDLYAVFMNREADAEGLSLWVSFIDQYGMSRDEVLSQFAVSAEFKAIAASYGLQ